jgi:hypothetical protein
MKPRCPKVLSLKVSESRLIRPDRWDAPDSPFKGQIVPAVSLFLKPADVLFPLKVVDELFTDLADAELNEKMQFRKRIKSFGSGRVSRAPVPSGFWRAASSQVTRVFDLCLCQSLTRAG